MFKELKHIYYVYLFIEDGYRLKSLHDTSHGKQYTVFIYKHQITAEKTIFGISS